MQLAHPGWLILLVFMPVPLVLELARPRIRVAQPGRIRPSDAGGPPWVLCRLPPILRGLAIGAMVVALARPQSVGGVIRIAAKGVAIMAALDQSSSMNTVDFPADADTHRSAGWRPPGPHSAGSSRAGRRPDRPGGLRQLSRPRLPADARPSVPDRKPPPRAVGPARRRRHQHRRRPRLGARRPAGTTPAKKVLMLLTDGNNQPAVPHPLDPVLAAELARDLGVTLHTIAIGKAGGVVHGTDATDLPVMAEVEGPNIPSPERLAEITGGRSFVATDADAIDEVFETISRLEKSQIKDEIHTRYDERFVPWAALAAALLVIDRLLVAGPLRRLP